MSAETEKQIKVLQGRGVPDTDPRVQGLKRRVEADAAAANRAADTTERVRKAMQDFLKEK